MFPNQASRIKEDCIREFADLSDEHVMLEVQQGNGDAFAVLFDRYHRLVLVTALKIVRDVGEAEEVTQNVFFEIYRAAGKFDPTRDNLKVYQSRKVHSGHDREKPEIIEIPRFIPRRIGKSDDLLGRDFVQTVNCDLTIFGQVFEFRIGA